MKKKKGKGKKEVVNLIRYSEQSVVKAETRNQITKSAIGKVSAGGMQKDAPQPQRKHILGVYKN